MSQQLVLALYVIGVGLTVAATATHLYQGLARQEAALRYDGRTFLSSMGHLALSFVCGPYIMLQLGWRQDEGGAIALGSALLSAFVAFGWSFMTGLLFLGMYISVTG